MVTYDKERGKRFGELAFLVLQDAFLQLAAAFATRDGADVQSILAGIKGDIAFTMQQTITERPDLISTDMLLDAMSAVRTVLVEAETLSRATQSNIRRGVDGARLSENPQAGGRSLPAGQHDDTRGPDVS